jgi:hypothetical protein
MQCPQCQHENQEGTKFCNECGTPLPVVCTSCQTANHPGAKFCNECGTPLAASTSSPSAPQHLTPHAVTDVQPALPLPLPLQATTLQTSAPSALADTMLASQSALEGERKQVTMLFADISGFTALAETMDPEDVRQVMNACFAQLVLCHVETIG